MIKKNLWCDEQSPAFMQLTIFGLEFSGHKFTSYRVLKNAVLSEYLAPLMGQDDDAPRQ